MLFFTALVPYLFPFLLSSLLFLLSLPLSLLLLLFHFLLSHSLFLSLPFSLSLPLPLLLFFLPLSSLFSLVWFALSAFPTPFQGLLLVVAGLLALFLFLLYRPAATAYFRRAAC
ncbi:hypothetical protein [Burkholderia thailandensis]|uniref:hypothetical protein n=1 Tax=Burkholderia thailandensis TaxID=57975 RepID=UPI00217E857D|nr:hypothetical protein [Burkholderia thailandensis]MCS6520795.1 hypothetical protein [Burkholderia thailandensis]